VTTVTVHMPDEVLAVMRNEPEGFGREMRLAAAINWYHRGIISQEIASQVAGLDRTDFLLALASRSADSFVVDFDDLQRELRHD